MTQFCKGCPLKREAIGEITSVYKLRPPMPEGVQAPERFRRISPVLIGVFVDDQKRPSSPVWLPDDDARFKFQTRYTVEQIDKCQAPITEVKGLLRREKHVICPAIGNIAVEVDYPDFAEDVAHPLEFQRDHKIFMDLE